MKCPACGYQNKEQSKTCRQCGASLGGKKIRRSPGMVAAHALLMTAAVLITLIVAGLLFYRVYFWVDNWKLEHYYQRTDNLAPSVEKVTLDNGLAAHSITFFGEDGDHIFIKQLQSSYPIVGGLARVDIPDSQWFGASPEGDESALVTLTPVLHTQGGDQRLLPNLELEIPTPQSPLTLITPATDFEQVYTSTYLLSFQVVPGSTVLVGNSDVSDVINFEGIAEVNIEVYPQGDNPVSILVSTQNHKQTRMDINLYRQPQEINLEPSLTVAKTSNLKTVRITGSTDPGAILSVDTPHEPDSIKVDEDGDFSFIANLETVGDNTVTFRASMEGKTDSVVSINVYYVPSLEVYSRKAWAMDYVELSKYYETWLGRIFLCDGIVTDVWVEDEEQTVIMNLNMGEGDPQYVVLTNLSSVGSPEIGARYKAYADVSGHQFYGNMDCPKLICRYMLMQ